MKVTYQRTERVTITLPEDRLPESQDFEEGEREYGEWLMVSSSKAARLARATRPAQRAQMPRRKRGRPRKNEPQ